MSIEAGGKIYFTVQEVATLLELAEPVLEEAIKTDELSGVRIRKTWYVTQEAVKNWLESRRWSNEYGNRLSRMYFYRIEHLLSEDDKSRIWESLRYWRRVDPDALEEELTKRFRKLTARDGAAEEQPLSRLQRVTKFLDNPGDYVRTTEGSLHRLSLRYRAFKRRIDRAEDHLIVATWAVILVGWIPYAIVASISDSVSTQRLVLIPWLVAVSCLALVIFLAVLFGIVNLILITTWGLLWKVPRWLYLRRH